MPLLALSFNNVEPARLSCLDVSIVPEPVEIEVTGKLHKVRSYHCTLSDTLAEEAYRIEAKRGRISIIGGSEAGIFWGRQTLRELFSQYDGKIPDIRIYDEPEFHYRGVHLDCCRFFYQVEDIKIFIDIISLHKFNVFHWHLTEDQGWRAEIKKYPLLTAVGSVRKGSIINNYDGERIVDDKPVSGYYTQEQMRDIVAYAAERYVRVIPEIEMPGHCMAALAAYPELGCTGGPYEVVRTTADIIPDILCAGKDNTVRFLKDVLDEICDIFPSEYIHIGGDESPRIRWKECPDCQTRMKELGLDDESQLQSYLVREVQNHLASKGRRIIGWDEILDGGVDTTATIMSWRGTLGGKVAARKGNDVVLAPTTYCYFDYFQTNNPADNGEGIGIGGYINLEQAFSFNPYDDLDADARKHIKGIQANLWTSHFPSFDDVQPRMLPRIAATAEVAWSASRRSSYDVFVQKMKTAMLPIYEEEGYIYADYAFLTPPVE
ncbi:MAG: beta-N-acetylhexosaminidase [Bacteroidales bacterium]|nr:beta-N-acetylhexosaminidase [Candidatus Equibacterium intestinale]